MSYLFSFFFFQAEDGIRDGHVTGVQTCALPISWCRALLFCSSMPRCDNFRTNYCVMRFGSERYGPSLNIRGTATRKGKTEIGRASCRDREATWYEACT